jgi:hypothetical protein
MQKRYDFSRSAINPYLNRPRKQLTYLPDKDALVRGGVAEEKIQSQNLIKSSPPKYVGPFKDSEDEGKQNSLQFDRET